MQNLHHSSDETDIDESSTEAGVNINPYEQQRLKNIAANNAWIAAHLGEEVSAFNRLDLSRGIDCSPSSWN